MNANELADELQKMFVGEEYDRLVHEIPNVLRQQQAEIKQQQEEKKALYNLVAEQDKKIIDLAFGKVYAERSAEVVAELYTHPVKELTDEEILQFQDKVPYTLGSDLIAFARAILRKAQE